jgi:phosphatidylglycerophosphate synthase
MNILAYRPFLDPLDASPLWWAFLVPLALLIAIAYKAVRMREIEGMGPEWKGALARSVVLMALQIIASIVLLWVASYFVILKLLPIIAPMPGT